MGFLGADASGEDHATKSARTLQLQKKVVQTDVKKLTWIWADPTCLSWYGQLCHTPAPIPLVSVPHVVPMLGQRQMADTDGYESWCSTNEGCTVTQTDGGRGHVP